MRSPFKFLEAFQAADRADFFGRDDEVAALYDMVMKNRLLLLYGQSGTGKTSLVQCGLASRFDATDWYPLFVRRNRDLNQSLADTLTKAGTQGQGQPLADAVQELYLNYLRPVYLIFDQLEELFILGSDTEQNKFILQLKSLLENGVPCRVILIIREEYLAHLYHFEKVIPNLFDRRLRVEQMGLSKVKQVLSGSFARYNISIEAPVDLHLDLIIEKLSGGKSGIPLPYLQVYLDLLYRADYSRSYPGEMPGENGLWKPIVITSDEIQALGGMEAVLETFLSEQQSDIQRTINERFPNADPESVKKVLDAFVSEGGTKKPIAYEQSAGKLFFDKSFEVQLASIPLETVRAICTALQTARILRFGDAYIELAHDTLAILIDGQRSLLQRRVHQALNQLNIGYQVFQEFRQYLSRKQLNSLEEILPDLEPSLSEEVKDFIQKSRDHAIEQEQADLIAERKKRRTARRIAIVGFSLAILAAGGMITAVLQYQKAAKSAVEARLNYANTLKVEGKYTDALEQLNQIQPFSGTVSSQIAEKLRVSQDKWRKMQALVLEADQMSQHEKYRQARDLYQKAYDIDPDAHLQSQIKLSEENLERSYQTAMKNGELLLTTQGGLERAKQFFELAIDLKPGDPAATAKLLLLDKKGK